MRTFRAILARENVETDEGWLTRVFPPGCFEWGAGTHPVTVNHDDSQLSGTVLGRIDRIERLDTLILGYGVLDDEGTGEAADLRRDLIRQIDERMVNALSVEASGLDVREECVETDEDGWCTALRVTFDRYEIGAVSVVTIPAIEGTLIELDPPAAASAEDEAIAAAVPAVPPAAWFADPQLAELTRRPVVDDDGRVYVHLASWEDCHVAFSDRCVTPWRSESSYAYFEACEVVTDAGPVRVGTLALSGGHYPTDSEHARDWRGAQAHYDDPSSVVAYVAAGEDAHGIWLAGALAPGVTAQQVATLRAHQLSGDWRRIGGAMELVGCCSVNVPGFVRQVAVSASAGGLVIDAAIVSAGSGRRAEACCDACAASGGRCETHRPAVAEAVLDDAVLASVAALLSRVDALERLPEVAAARARLRAELTGV